MTYNILVFAIGYIFYGAGAFGAKLAAGFEALYLVGSVLVGIFFLIAIGLFVMAKKSKSAAETEKYGKHAIFMVFAVIFGIAYIAAARYLANNIPVDATDISQIHGFVAAVMYTYVAVIVLAFVLEKFVRTKKRAPEKQSAIA